MATREGQPPWSSGDPLQAHRAVLRPPGREPPPRSCCRGHPEPHLRTLVLLLLMAGCCHTVAAPPECAAPPARWASLRLHDRGSTRKIAAVMPDHPLSAGNCSAIRRFASRFSKFAKFASSRLKDHAERCWDMHFHGSREAVLAHGGTSCWSAACLCRLLMPRQPQFQPLLSGDAAAPLPCTCARRCRAGCETPRVAFCESDSTRVREPRSLTAAQTAAAGSCT